MKTFINPNNILVLWTFITGWAAFSIYLEQKYNYNLIFFFKFSLEDVILASNTCIDALTIAASMTVSKSWSKLICTLGYVIGNLFI